MTLLFQIFMVSSVLALVVVEIDSLTAAGVVVVNIAVLAAAADVDPDVLNEADKLGLGSLLPGPVFPLDNTRQ